MGITSSQGGGKSQQTGSRVGEPLLQSGLLNVQSGPNNTYNLRDHWSLAQVTTFPTVTMHVVFPPTRHNQTREDQFK